MHFPYLDAGHILGTMPFWTEEEPMRRIQGILEAEQDNYGGEERPGVIVLYTRCVALSLKARPASGHISYILFLPGS